LNPLFQIGIFEMMTNENVGFDFISDRYKIKYTEPLYESEIRTEF